ncbi:MAG TPA: hypothetical protein VF761_04765 [Gemmatimonadaceae bacterium]
MSKTSRILTVVASLLLLGVFAFPLWSVHLTAPQYPEGIGMTIHVNTVKGLTEFDLAKINSLNHYIGMKAIEPDAIPELRIMPWIVGALVVTGLLVAALGRRGPLYAWFGAFGALGVAGLVDFWKWEYEYGHDLSPDAIIRIPGMSYQPPLIGSKALLNFNAASWPALGGVLAGVAFALAATAVILTVRAVRRRADEPSSAAGAAAPLRGAVAAGP